MADISEGNSSISYVENHNSDWDYGLSAFDYKMATDALIAQQLNAPSLSNWTAPICHLARQSIELELKWLVQAISWIDEEIRTDITFSHNLQIHALDQIYADQKEIFLGLASYLQAREV